MTENIAIVVKAEKWLPHHLMGKLAYMKISFMVVEGKLLICRCINQELHDQILQVIRNTRNVELILMESPLNESLDSVVTRIFLTQMQKQLGVK